MAELTKRKQTLTKSMASNIRFVLDGNKGKRSGEMADIFRAKFNPSHWPRLKLARLFKGLIDGQIEIVETFDRGRVAASKKPSKTVGTKPAKQKKASRMPTQHIAEVSVATRTVAVPYEMLERLQHVAGKRHLVFNISAFGIQIASEASQPTVTE
jgi:hypothetical protein